MPYKDPNEQREYMARYAASPKGKAAQAARSARYKARPDIKAAQAAAQAKYNARPDVKAAQAARTAYYLYGLTPQDVERMFADQAGLCAACMDEISLVIGAENYRHIDHDHAKQKGEPGYIRGLLCKKCNAAAGLLKDSPDRCLGLGIYLGAHR